MAGKYPFPPLKPKGAIATVDVDRSNRTFRFQAGQPGTDRRDGAGDVEGGEERRGETERSSDSSLGFSSRCLLSTSPFFRLPFSFHPCPHLYRRQSPLFGCRLKDEGGEGATSTQEEAGEKNLSPLLLCLCPLRLLLRRNGRRWRSKTPGSCFSLDTTIR